jgi:hypothetical protein
LKFRILRIWIFAFCGHRPARPSGQIAKWHQKSLSDLCGTPGREASQTCTYVPFTTKHLCCRCALLLKRRTPCRQTSLHRPRYRA